MTEHSIVHNVNVWFIDFFFSRCTGSEFILTRCAHVNGNAATACTHGGDVGVECNAPSTTECDQHTTQLHNVR